MTRTAAALMAALLTLQTLAPAACARAQAAGPFPEVPLPARPSAGHGWAYASLAAGAVLIGSSFVLSERGNQRYDDYLVATDPERIQRLYDETVRLDRASNLSLLGGEALVATGLWLRFLRRPSSSRLGLDLRPDRWALALSF